MCEGGGGKAAIKDIDLLLKVARHKEVFFSTACACYADALLAASMNLGISLTC